MKEVPTVITTKDLLYLDDMLSWNFTTVKKINHYINEVVDEDVINLLTSVSKTFTKHYTEILECLNLGGSDED